MVGDPKQLPPTNFFGRADDEDEDLPEIERDMPSILDEVAAAGVPERRLDWHYRSRDEALIAFSNRFYYRGRLVTFPAPSPGAGALQFHKVDGVYVRGHGGRVNHREGEAVAEMVRDRLLAWLQLPEADRLTLGVITFNSEQQSLILDILDSMRREKPDLEWFFSEDREEPVIVKNLENIQGDERDVMLFSVTFGPDVQGKLTMNFGPLNNSGGERRLNVAVTRARRELHVFSSILAEQIDLGRTHAQGVRDFKTFLDYAERGVGGPAGSRRGFSRPSGECLRGCRCRSDRTARLGSADPGRCLGIPHRSGSSPIRTGREAICAASNATGRNITRRRPPGIATRSANPYWRDWDGRSSGSGPPTGSGMRAPWSTALTRSFDGFWRRIASDGRRTRPRRSCRLKVREKRATRLPASYLPCGSVTLRRHQVRGNRCSMAPWRTIGRRAKVLLVVRVDSLKRCDGARAREMWHSARRVLRTKVSEWIRRGSSRLDTRRSWGRLILTIAEAEGPLPLEALARRVAHEHGWQRTGKRILQRVREKPRDSRMPLGVR